MDLKELDLSIEKVPNFPKEGILFYDITSILTKPKAYNFCLRELSKKAALFSADAIISIEARGFLFSAGVCDRLGMPQILARKKGKLPGQVRMKEYDLEYGKSVICLQEHRILKGMRYLLLDDLIATGGTLKATSELVEELGGIVVGYIGVIGLPFLGYEKKLAPHRVSTIINYNTEKIEG